MVKDVFSPGQVAKICRVCHATVNVWCDKGLLPHRKVPGSKHRRISRADLEAFMTQHEMPLAWISLEKKVVVVAAVVVELPLITRLP